MLSAFKSHCFGIFHIFQRMINDFRISQQRFSSHASDPLFIDFDSFDLSASAFAQRRFFNIESIELLTKRAPVDPVAWRIMQSVFDWRCYCRIWGLFRYSVFVVIRLACLELFVPFFYACSYSLLLGSLMPFLVNFKGLCWMGFISACFSVAGFFAASSLFHFLISRMFMWRGIQTKDTSSFSL